MFLTIVGTRIVYKNLNPQLIVVSVTIKEVNKTQQILQTHNADKTCLLFGKPSLNVQKAWKLYQYTEHLMFRNIKLAASIKIVSTGYVFYRFCKLFHTISRHNQFRL